MTARVLSGKDVAAVVRGEVAGRVAALAERGKSVGLATVLVGDDAASKIYVAGKHKAAEAAGMISVDRNLPASAGQHEVEATIGELNADPRVDGMILQLPLPDGLDGDRAVVTIDPGKDADGLHPYNLGLVVLGRTRFAPATPSGIMRILRHYDIPTAGKRAVVVGRSFLVGKPIALLLGARGVDATVTMAHSRTPDLASLTRSADILVVAAGQPGLIGGDHIGAGATVIDVGIHRTDDGLVGDVVFDEAMEVAGAITPVPGGVGPMTIAALLENTVLAAETAR